MQGQEPSSQGHLGLRPRVRRLPHHHVQRVPGSRREGVVHLQEAAQQRPVQQREQGGEQGLN